MRLPGSRGWTSFVRRCLRSGIATTPSSAQRVRCPRYRTEHPRRTLPSSATGWRTTLPAGRPRWFGRAHHRNDCRLVCKSLRGRGAMTLCWWSHAISKWVLADGNRRGRLLHARWHERYAIRGAPLRELVNMPLKCGTCNTGRNRWRKQ